MKLPGRLWKNGKYWLIEVPALDLMTQGHTKEEALFMIKDAIESLINQPSFKITIQPSNTRIKINSIEYKTFSIEANDIKTLIALMLNRQRTANNLTIQQVTERIGATSKNAYAQYEKGKSEPSLSKIIQLMKAINPKADLELSLSLQN